MFYSTSLVPGIDAPVRLEVKAGRRDDVWFVAKIVVRLANEEMHASKLKCRGVYSTNSQGTLKDRQSKTDGTWQEAIRGKTGKTAEGQPFGVMSKSSCWFGRQRCWHYCATSDSWVCWSLVWRKRGVLNWLEETLSNPVWICSPLKHCNVLPVS